MFGLSVATLVIGIILIAFILFMTELIPLAATAISVAVGFYLIGAIDANTALKSFSSPTTMIIASMAVIGEAVFKTGGAEKIGHILTRFSKSERQLVFATVLLSGIMSGFLSNTGAAALLIALILGVSNSTGMKRSKLIYPVIVGCCFGGGITIVGTTSGPFLKETLEGLGIGQTMGFFEFAPLSLLLLVISAFYMATIGYNLLPDEPQNQDDDYSAASLTVDYSKVPAWKRILSLAVMVGAFLGMIFSDEVGIPLHFIGLIGAILVVAFRCISMKEASRSVPISGIIIYAAMVPVAAAMKNSGAAQMIADGTLNFLGSISSPMIILFCIFLIITPHYQLYVQRSHHYPVHPHRPGYCQHPGNWPQSHAGGRPVRCFHCHCHPCSHARQLHGRRTRGLPVHRFRKAGPTPDLYQCHCFPGVCGPVLSPVLLKLPAKKPGQRFLPLARLFLCALTRR